MSDWRPGPIPARITIPRRLARRKFPIRGRDDFELLEQAARALPEVSLEDLTGEVLLAIQKERGVDFATALFFDRARKEAPAPLVPGTAIREVLVVPAALYLHYPEFSGDGEIFRSIAKSHGLPARLAPVASLGSTDENARIIAGMLEKAPARSVLMATLSKGAADFRRALELYPWIAEKIAGWLMASGIPYGTYVCNRMLEARQPKRTLIGWNLWLHGGTWEYARSAKAGPDAPLAPRLHASQFPFPVASVFGCPLKHHLTSFARPRHEHLTRHGPNEGCTLLPDSYIAGSRLFPIWGADHFLFVPEASFVLRNAFAVLAGAPPLLTGRREGTYRTEANLL